MRVPPDGVPDSCRVYTPSGTGHRDRTQLLGAAAQLHRIYACFNRTRPHRTVAVDTVLKYQHKVTGVWGVGGTPSRLDYDGLYTATHAAQLVAGDHTTGYRRADIRAACAAYVAAAHRHLSNATAVLGLGTGVRYHPHATPYHRRTTRECHSSG